MTKLNNLASIIEANDNGLETGNSLLIEKLLPYRRSLCTYYADKFQCEPILMVVMVCNAVQYGLIVPSNEFGDALYQYCETMEFEDEEDRAEFEELVSFQSIPFSKL